MPSRFFGLAALTGGLFILTAWLVGCTDTPPSDDPSATVSREHDASATPTPVVPPGSAEARRLAYAADTAAWKEPLPEGYRWPDWDELPHVGTQELIALENAQGVYRCMLIDAAWHAYFEDNDPEAAKDYATQADAYVTAEDTVLTAVTLEGDVVDQELVSVNGRCLAVSGELDH